MAKATRTTIRGIGLNDIVYDEDDTGIINVKTENDDGEIVEYEEEDPELIKMEPDMSYDYTSVKQEIDDENAEFVITEIDDPAAYLTEMDELRPFKKPKLSPPEPSSSSSGKYFCEVCGKRFAYMRSYNQHRIVHLLRTDVTKCDICHKELKRTALDYHMKYRHVEARNFQCMVCGNRFKSPGALRHHTATFHPSNTFDCDECERVFKSLEAMKKHKEIHKYRPVKVEKFDCQYCNKTFQNQGQLTLHIGILGKKIGKCRDTL